MRHRLAVHYTLVLFFCAIAQHAVAREFTLVLAADMPEIADQKMGSYAHLHTLLTDTRRTDDRVFFLFGGGSIGPSAMARFDRGSHIIDILNTLEPDVMGITKREFSYFQDELSLRAYEAAFPLVSSNAVDLRTSQPIDGVVRSVLVEKDNIQLGFVSLLNERVISEYLLPDLDIQEPRQTIVALSKSLREQGAQVVVLHYSFPYEFIESLLEEKAIDIAFLSDTRVQEKFQFEAKTTLNLLSLNNSQQAIVARFKIDNEVKKIDANRIDLISLEPDTRVQQQLAGYRQRLDRLLNNEIGQWKSKVSTYRREVRSSENGFANYVADAMRNYANADIAIINGGSIRGNTQYMAGTAITRKDIVNELPFRSYLSVASVTGAHIKAMLEKGLSEIQDLQGGFPHLSGVQLTFDSSNIAGNRVVSVLINGKPLENEQLYRLATTDYLATGGDDYPSLSDTGNLTISELLVSDIVIDTIAVQQDIKASLDKRLVDINSAVRTGQ